MLPPGISANETAFTDFIKYLLVFAYPFPTHSLTQLKFELLSTRKSKLLPELLPRSLNQHTCNMRIKTSMVNFQISIRYSLSIFIFQCAGFARIHGWKSCDCTQSHGWEKVIYNKGFFTARLDSYWKELYNNLATE